MRVRVSEPTITSEWRWIVVFPSITLSDTYDVHIWLHQCDIPFDNVGATYWIKEREHVELMLLRWS